MIPGNDSSADDIERYAFLVALANDHVIDEKELAFIKHLALRDHLVDEEERDVLRGIFSRMNSAEMSPQQRASVAAFRAQYDI